MEQVTKKGRLRKKRKKISKRRRVRNRNQETASGIAIDFEDRVDQAKGSLLEIESAVSNLNTDLGKIEDVIGDLDELTRQLEGVAIGKEDVLSLLRVILNLSENDELMLDEREVYIPLERPRVPLSQLQRIALELHGKVMKNDR